MSPASREPLRVKALQIYQFISDQLYLNRPDMRVNDDHFNTALLLSLLVGLSHGKALIIGEPGLGKTTSAEFVGTLLYRIPLGTLWKAEVAGHPEQTEEKIIGRPDLGKLNLGEEAVIWSHFVLLPVKIIDEINRLPETKQSMILNGVDRGNWEYLNDAVINSENCLFATANYQDRGTNTIIAPLMDRFDVMVESRHPGANLAGIIGTNGAQALKLRNEALEQAFKDVIRQTLPYRTRMGQIRDLSEKFGTDLSKQSAIPSLAHDERALIRGQTSRIPFDDHFNAALRLVIAELSFCHHYGQKRSGEVCEEGCHFSGYLCARVENCLSNRFPASTRKLCRTLAWLVGDQTVGLGHLEAVLPFTLAHRIQWMDQAIAACETEQRNDPLQIHMAKKAVREMLRRYREQAQRIRQALAAACRIAEGEAVEPLKGDHPLYHEIRKDLGA